MLRTLFSRRNVLASLVAASCERLFGQATGMSSGGSKTQSRLPPTGRIYSKFTDIAAQAGLNSVMVYGGEKQIKFIIESMGGGCAFIDYDNDGWMDIFLLGGSRLEGSPPGASNRLYRNNRDGTFTDVTAHAGLLDSGWACGVCVGDYNNDGFEDIFCTYYGHNKLYRNNGDGTFTDVTRASGLFDATTRFATGCSFFDYNAMDIWIFSWRTM